MQRSLIPTLLLAISVLAACGALDRSQQLFPTASSTGVVTSPDISLPGEKLDTKKITVRADCGSKTWDVRFKAHGRASGPYPGTFYTSGSWSSESGGSFGTYEYSFKQRFTIHSGKTVIGGTASSDWELGSCDGYSSEKGEVIWHTKNPKESGSLVVNGITQYGLFEEFNK